MNIDFLEEEEHREWLCVSGLGCIEHKFVEIFGVSNGWLPQKIAELEALNDMKKNLSWFVELAEAEGWRVFVWRDFTYMPYTTPQTVAVAICEVCRI